MGDGAKILPTSSLAAKYAVGMTAKPPVDLEVKSSVAEAQGKGRPKPNYSMGALIMYKIDTFISTRKGQTIALISFGTVFTLLMGMIISAALSMHIAEGIWDSWMYMTFPGAQRDAQDWVRTACFVDTK
jgi:hypothetical protein